MTAQNKDSDPMYYSHLLSLSLVHSCAASVYNVLQMRMDRVPIIKKELLDITCMLRQLQEQLESLQHSNLDGGMTTVQAHLRSDSPVHLETNGKQQKHRSSQPPDLVPNGFTTPPRRRQFKPKRIRIPDDMTHHKSNRFQHLDDSDDFVSNYVIQQDEA